GVLLVTFSIVGFLLGRWIKKVDEKQTQHDDEIKEVKENYISRFEGVNNRLSEVEKNIVGSISDLKDYLNENFVRK
ncbi:MAG: hypothetical protein AB1394_14900, partial [Bacteroidota bacterium]